MSDALREKQQALLEALWQPRHEDAIARLTPQTNNPLLAEGPQWQRGLKAYRSNASALAQRALGGAYPVVAQLLGEDNFGALAHSLWRRHPPVRGDVAQWGGALPAHIEALPDLIAQEPYLADVARIEWLLHIAAAAANATMDAASFTLLTHSEPDTFTLVPAPGTACLASRYPVASIVNAHLSGEPSLQEAGQRLRDGVREIALVWREGLTPRLRHIDASEAAFVDALQQRRSLAHALQVAPGLDFNIWLAPAVQNGLVIAALALPPAQETTP